MASLFDGPVRNPGADGDVGVRWLQPFTAFATTANDTRAHLIANNEMAGGVTPATFQDPAGNDRRIDWLVLHHGNDFVILNLDANLTDITQADYRVGFRDRATSTVWTYAVRMDANEADPYEVPATQADLDAIVAVISDGGTLDVIIYDDDTAGNLSGWNANTLTYDDPLALSGSLDGDGGVLAGSLARALPPTLFIVDDGGDELWRVDDPSSPGDAVLVGNLPAGITNPKGLASYGGVLYCVDDSGNELWRIDIDDPSSSTLIGTFPSDLDGPGGLVVHNGVMFAVDNGGDQLWRIDTVNPTNSVLIGELPSDLQTPDGLASHNGVLYCCDSSSGADLWNIDTAFPENSTEVGDFPSGIVWPNGLASHGGNLYCIDNSGDDLWILDTTALANSTLVGTVPGNLGAPRGFASHSIPVPGTTTITVDLGDDQTVRGDLDYVLPAMVTVNNPVGVPVYLWERVSTLTFISIDDAGRLHPVAHTPDVSQEATLEYRLTVTNNGVSASASITLTITPHLRPPAFATNSASLQTWMVGNFVTFLVPTPNGNPPPVLTADGLPPGWQFSLGGGVQGPAQTGGSGTIVITATNSQGTDTYSIPYVINPITVSGSLNGVGGTLAGTLGLLDRNLSISGSLNGAGGTLAGEILLVTVPTKTPIPLSGSLNGAGGTLAGELLLITLPPTSLEVSGSMSGAGGTLVGSLTLGDVVLPVSGTLVGAGGSLTGQLVRVGLNELIVSGAVTGAGGSLVGGLSVQTSLMISGPLIGAGGALFGSIVSDVPTLFISGSLSGSGGLLVGSLESIRTDFPISGSVVGDGGFLVGDIAILADPLMERFPTLVLSDSENVLLPQYDESTRLHTLLRNLIGIVQRNAINPLQTLERALNPSVSEGVLLDWIGIRLSLPRPFVATADAEYFGFEGTAPTGKTFGQAPFYTQRRGVELVEPIGDATYRTFLIARARRLRGGANRENIEAILDILFGNGYVDESGTPVTLQVTIADGVIWRLVSGSLFSLLIPRPAGRRLTMTRTDP